MQVTILDIYQDTKHHLEGSTEDVRAQVLDLYPFLRQKFGPQCSIGILIDALNKTQFAYASISDSISKSEENPPVVDGQGLHVVRYDQEAPVGQLNTSDVFIEVCKAAAAFLAGHECTARELRQALLEADGDAELAALIAHGLPATSMPDLRAVLAASDLKKSEQDDTPVKFLKVEPTNESSKAFAEIISRASEEGEIRSIKLTGKHAKGILRARDSVTHKSYILKPGAGRQNPIVGENETSATQSQREVAFYAVACAFGLGEYLPECHLLLLDDKEFACMAFLSFNFKNLNDLKVHDASLPRRLLSLYNDGTLHRWAALDYVCGNPDRHSGNVMASGDSVRLIDHGSSFCGLSFDPAKDGMSFVPYYLRPSVVGFNKMSVDDKLRNMPRLNAENAARLKKWLLELNSGILGQLVTSYGIDPRPEQIRLERLQAATEYQSADLAVLSSWVVG
jgi:hypothetical protein